MSPPGARSPPIRGREQPLERHNRNDTIRSTENNKMAAVQETIEQVKSIDVDKYKYGFETDI
ncbi:MAG: hypothetical protein J0I57_00160, partial [Hyphomicrobium sp.]|nr:hypothetical protein [Hyphomicrobium sp.]